LLGKGRCKVDGHDGVMKMKCSLILNRNNVTACGFLRS
jgi:hypothetical protein